MWEAAVGLIESSSRHAGYRLIDPCGRCGRAEGVWSVVWPGKSDNEFRLLCEQCLWRTFNDMPKGRIRRDLVRKVLRSRVISRSQ